MPRFKDFVICIEMGKLIGDVVYSTLGGKGGGFWLLFESGIHGNGSFRIMVWSC